MSVCRLKRYNEDCGILKEKKKFLAEGGFGKIYSSNNLIIKENEVHERDMAVSCLFNHPNILKFKSIITQEDCKIDPKVEEILVTKRYSTDKFGLFMIEEILQGLYALSTLKFVQYDMKPENILRDKRRGIVSDLGGCLFTEKPMYDQHGIVTTYYYNPPTMYARHRDTLTGEFHGVYSFALMCAEMYLDEPIDFDTSNSKAQGIKRVKIEHFIDVHERFLTESLKSKNKIVKYLSKHCLKALLEFKRTRRDTAFLKLPSFAKILEDLKITTVDFSYNLPEVECIYGNTEILKKYHSLLQIILKKRTERYIKWQAAVCLAVLLFKGTEMDSHLTKELIKNIQNMHGSSNPVEPELSNFFISQLDGMLMPITGWNFGRPFKEIHSPLLWKEYRKLKIKF